VVQIWKIPESSFHGRYREYEIVNTVSKITRPLSISDILGNVVTVSDYSSFAVRFLDRWKLWMWSPGQTIEVSANANPKYPYRISNMDVSFARSAAAKIITRGQPPDIQDDGV